MRCSTLFALSMLAVAVLASVVPAAAEDANFFTHGPVLGRLSAHGVGIWARTARSGEFVVKYGTAADALDQISEPVATKLDHDNTGWVHIKGLNADTKYFYELALPDRSVCSGRASNSQGTAIELYEAAQCSGRIIPDNL